MEILRGAKLFEKVALWVKHQSSHIQFYINDMDEQIVVLLIKFAE